MENTDKNHWTTHAGLWSALASPLRPCLADIEVYKRVFEASGSPVLLLGVTPELACLPGRLVAVEKNARMIHSLWRPGLPDHAVLQGDWLSLPLQSRSVATVLGDGVLVCQTYPAGYRRMFQQLQHVIKAGGRLCLRLFTCLEHEASVEEVSEFVWQNRIGSFHAFKWQLAMALVRKSTGYNINVTDIHAQFNRVFPDRDRLAEATGWHREAIATIDSYAGSSLSYSFPPLGEVLAVIPPSLRVLSVVSGAYELAERCPLIELQAD